MSPLLERMLHAGGDFAGFIASDLEEELGRSLAKELCQAFRLLFQSKTSCPLESRKLKTIFPKLIYNSGSTCDLVSTKRDIEGRRNEAEAVLILFKN